MRKSLLLRVPLLTLAIAAVNGHSATMDTLTPFPQACLSGMTDDQLPPAGAPTWSARHVLSAIRPRTDPVNPILASGLAQINVWRVACGGADSAVLLRIEDVAHPGGPSNLLFPTIGISQGGTRVTLRPSRVVGGARVWYGAYGYVPSTFVLIPEEAGVRLDSAFDLIVTDSLSIADLGSTVSIPAYEPTPETYPAAFGPRPISGHYKGNFFDPAKPGEGIVVEIGDVPDRRGSHYLQFSWHSFDNTGKPFWISGGDSFQDGATHLHMPAAFRRGGRFAGAKPADELNGWGTVDIEFNDCQTVSIVYAANPDLPRDVPAGSGRLQWQRLTSASGYSCQ